MGGRAAGKRASEEAARVIQEELRAGARGSASAAERLRRAIERANDHVWQLSESDPSLHGMGTTIAAILIEGDTAHIAHVGDSRVYRIRAGAIVPLTRDHSYLAELAERGIELPDARLRARYGNLLSRAVGVEPVVEVDLASEPIAAGDTFIICSDGVYRLVETPELCALVAAGGDDLARVCESIVTRANAGGGPDNATVIVLRALSDGKATSGGGGGGA